jgi:hypothetical protein
MFTGRSVVGSLSVVTVLMSGAWGPPGVNRSARLPVFTDITLRSIKRLPRTMCATTSLSGNMWDLPARSENAWSGLS